MGSLAGIAFVDLLLANMMAEPNMMDASVKVEPCLLLIAEVCIRWRLTADWKPRAEGAAFLTQEEKKSRAIQRAKPCCGNKSKVRPYDSYVRNGYWIVWYEFAFIELLSSLY